MDQCSVCSVPYQESPADKKPVILPCCKKHICTKCLTVPPMTVCIFCKTAIDIGKIKSSSALLKLSMLQETSATAGTARCEANLAHGHATVFCPSCEKLMCRPCDETLHSIEWMKAHSRVALFKGLIAIKSLLKCPTHGDPYRLYCPPCNKIMCTACVATHACPKTDLRELKEVVSMKAGATKGLISSGKETSAKLLDKTETEIMKTDSVSTEEAVAEVRVHAYFDDVIAALNEKREELLDEVRHVYSKQIEIGEQETKSLLEMVRKVEEGLESLHILKDSTNEVAFLVAYDNLKRSIEEAQGLLHREIPHETLDLKLVPVDIEKHVGLSGSEAEVKEVGRKDTFSKTTTTPPTKGPESKADLPACTRSAPTTWSILESKEYLITAKVASAPTVLEEAKYSTIAGLEPSPELKKKVSEMLTETMDKLKSEPVLSLSKLPRTAAADVTHPNTCNVCKSTIKGARYCCLVCNDFDLCEKCKGTNFNCHKSTHPMITFTDLSYKRLIFGTNNALLVLKCYTVDAVSASLHLFLNKDLLNCFEKVIPWSAVTEDFRSLKESWNRSVREASSIPELVNLCLKFLEVLKPDCWKIPREGVLTLFKRAMNYYPEDTHLILLILLLDIHLNWDVMADLGQKFEFYLPMVFFFMIQSSKLISLAKSALL